MTDIVIPLYNQLDHTKRCLWAIEAHTSPPYRVIVVDNRSTDGTADWLLEQDVTVITNRCNEGFARAVNAGLKLGESPYVAILNNDVEVPQGWLKKLIQVMEGNPHLGAIGPLSTAETQDTYEGNFPSWASGAQIIEHYRPGGLPYSAVLLRREAIAEVGLLDEEFFLYGEDDDYNIRLIRAGWSLALHLGVTVKHEHGVTSKAAGLGNYRKSAMRLLKEKWGKRWLVCMIRVKNEELNIRRCLDSMPFVDKFIIIDNGCTDGTLDIAQEYPVVVIHTEGLDGTRDYNLGYEEAQRQNATHFMWMDADEEWEGRAAEVIPELLHRNVGAWMFRIYPFVLSKTHYRVDGPWAQFTQRGQPRLFQAHDGIFWASKSKAHPGLPRGVRGSVEGSELRIKHWTVQTPEEAERKIAFYEAADGRDYGHLRNGPGAILVEWEE